MSNTTEWNDDGIYMAFGATSWRFTDEVPAMSPGDSDVIEEDGTHAIRVTLLQEGVAALEIADQVTGEVLESLVVEVDEDFGRIQFEH